MGVRRKRKSDFTSFTYLRFGTYKDINPKVNTMTDIDYLIELVEEYGRNLYTAGTLNAMRSPESCQQMKDEAAKAYDAILSHLKDEE